jgi:hypothetical protein
VDGSISKKVSVHNFLSVETNELHSQTACIVATLHTRRTIHNVEGKSQNTNLRSGVFSCKIHLIVHEPFLATDLVQRAQNNLNLLFFVNAVMNLQAV